jgi:class 3 adenylate cyclase
MHVPQDIVSFTTISECCEPEDVMNMLHSLFTRYDTLSAEHGVFKVETIGGCSNLVDCLMLLD